MRPFSRNIHDSRAELGISARENFLYIINAWLAQNRDQIDHHADQKQFRSAKLPQLQPVVSAQKRRSRNR